MTEPRTLGLSDTRHDECADKLLLPRAAVAGVATAFPPHIVIFCSGPCDTWARGLGEYFREVEPAGGAPRDCVAPISDSLHTMKDFFTTGS